MKLKKENEMKEPVKMLMRNMPPLSVAKILYNEYVGHIVMRTSSYDKFEVMDLTNPGEDRCWTSRNTLWVEILDLDEITINLKGTK